jgi:hypothetical protein
MRNDLIWMLAVVALGTPVSSAEAQQPYWQRQSGASDTSRSPRTGTLDRFRPYGSSSASRPPQSALSYRSEPKPVPPEVTRTNFYSQRRDYFPGLRTGQGPNRSLSQGVPHCVPSRITMLSR